MKSIFEQSCENTQQPVHLSAQAKAAMRVDLIQFMERTPIRHGFFSRLASLPNLFAYIAKPIPLFSILLTLGMGIGTTYAADTALPGDVLYPVKIYINEEVRGLVAISDEDRAQWAVDRAQRRLDEASRLVALGALNSEIRAGIESDFSQSFDRVQKRILVLTSSGNDDVAFEMSSRFESALRAHQEVFTRLKEKEQKVNKKEIDSLLKEVDRQVEHARTVRVTFEVKDTKRNQASVDKKIALLKAELANGRAYIAEQSVSLSAQSKVRVEAALLRADTLITQSQDAINSNDLTRSFISLQSASRELMQAKMLVHSLVDLSIDAPEKRMDVPTREEPKQPQIELKNERQREQLEKNDKRQEMRGERRENGKEQREEKPRR